MAVLSDLQPASVFRYFEEITQIPHGSHDTKGISDYVAEFGRKRGLVVLQDESNNVIIRAAASAGYEDEPGVMLQGHLDMVCEKTDDCDIDFTTDGLDLMIEGDYITARGTTLGGDDGIAVAYMLALLEDETIPHPALECVFTVDEEVGMLGATAMDMSVLQTRRMINLDSEEEGYLLTGCAGGATATCRLPISRREDDRPIKAITVKGLLGGHSGSDIHRGRGAANELLGRVLSRLEREVDFSLVEISGGNKENAIARSAGAVIAVDEADAGKVGEIVSEFDVIFRREYGVKDPGVEVALSEEASTEYTGAMDSASTRNVIAMLRMLPQGIMRMSPHVEGLVETSLNLGILLTGEEEVSAEFATRSSLMSKLDDLHDRMGRIMDLLGGSITLEGEYPAMEYREDSPLRDKMERIYKEMFGENLISYTLHAGVECGIFAGRLPGLDAVSIGPEMADVHTTQEILSISSVRRTWEFLLEVLKDKE